MVDQVTEAPEQGSNPADIPNPDAEKMSFMTAVNTLNTLKDDKNNKNPLGDEWREFWNSLGKQLFWPEDLWDALNTMPGFWTIASLFYQLLKFQGFDRKKFSGKTDNIDNDNKGEIAQKIQEIREKYKQKIEGANSDKESLKSVYQEMYKEILQYLMDNYSKQTNFEDIMDMKIEQARELKKLENEDIWEDRAPEGEDKTTLINETFTELEKKVNKGSKEYTKLQLEKIKYQCEDDVDQIMKNLKEQQEWQDLRTVFDGEWDQNNIQKIIEKQEKLKTFIQALKETGIMELRVKRVKEKTWWNIDVNEKIVNWLTELCITVFGKIITKLKDVKEGESIDKTKLLNDVKNEIENEINQNKTYTEQEKSFFTQEYNSSIVPMRESAQEGINRVKDSGDVIDITEDPEDEMSVS